MGMTPDGPPRSRLVVASQLARDNRYLPIAKEEQLTDRQSPCALGTCSCDARAKYHGYDMDDGPDHGNLPTRMTAEQWAILVAAFPEFEEEA